MTLKQEIKNFIEELIDDKITATKCLNKAKSINNKIKSEVLSDFIRRELCEEEYNDENMPEYRLILGETTFKFKNLYTGVTDTRKIKLPESTHFNGKSTNYRAILLSASEIEEAIKKNKGNTFNMLFTSGQFEVSQRYLASSLDMNPEWQLIQAYWAHSPTSFPEILFKIKQKLIDLLLEIDNSILDKESEEKIFTEKSHFDASFEIIQLIEKANKEIILIDGYVDGTTLKMLSSKKEKVSIKLLTNPKAISESFEILVEKFNKQYKGLEVKTSKSFHDRFLIIDSLNFYQTGSSIKDLGNLTFSFVKLKEKFITDALVHKFELEWNK